MRGERSAINPYQAALLLLLVAMLQTSAMPSLTWAGVMPDLMLLTVVSWSLLRGTREGLPWALGGGFLLDLLSGGPPAATIVALALASVITGMGELNIIRDSPWLPLAASLLATAIYDLVYWGILQVTGRSGVGVAMLLRVLVPSLLLNTAIIYPTYWALRWIHERAS